MNKPEVTPDLVLEPIPENLLREPIEYVFADHYRQRIVFAALDSYLAQDFLEAEVDAPARALLQSIVDFLDSEFALHIADEEEDLFPAIAARSADDPSGAAVLAQLVDEHRAESAELRYLVGVLRRLANGRQPADRHDFLRRALRFVEAQRHHMIWENSVLLPLARRCLEPEDLQRMGRRMAERRGLAYPD